MGPSLPSILPSSPDLIGLFRDRCLPSTVVLIGSMSFKQHHGQRTIPHHQPDPDVTLAPVSCNASYHHRYFLLTYLVACHGLQHQEKKDTIN
ncbi:hypothetical protein DPEC_G00357920 [Dallia pectoralis]|uniref:Uncharacterized protein n=1 Tax=Dallia pectoralis TaxID=75939 RepID=A0ACC2F099_DALPE|nr:hypothetical protein DPEC_G00357920 [Dallia pectoralis]